MADELNIPTHRYYQPRYNVALAVEDISKQYIYDSGIRKIDARIGEVEIREPLFSLAEPGVWYDPSDLTTLFQDTAGTTPVTTAGQTVALALDKSKGLVLGSELRGTGTVGLIGSATAATYDTGTGAGSVTRVDLSNQSFVSIPSLVNGNSYRVQITVLTGTILLRAGSATSTPLATISAGSSNLLVVPTTALVIASSSGTATFTLTSVRELPGFHATQATAASRPTYQVVNGRPCLVFDGIDDFLVTPTITPNIDKAQVFAGVRKLSDAAGATVVELSTTVAAVNGAMQLAAPASSGAASYGFRSRGTVLALSDALSAAYAAPTTNVLTGLGDISGDLATLRVNGTQAAQSTADQGTGNYLAYPLYIGRRAGTSLPFNGQLYSLVVRFGANLDANTISNTETWVNGRTGAY